MLGFQAELGLGGAQFLAGTFFNPLQKVFARLRLATDQKQQYEADNQS